MVVKVFITGVTGYIGGTVHAYLARAHPDYKFTLLVRDDDRAKRIKERYPDVNFAYGTLNDAAIVEKEASEADVVVHTADSSDNVPGAEAIAKGIAAGHTPEKPGYWLHLSGTSILTWFDAENGRWGEEPLPEQKYDDIEDIQSLISLPDAAHHRNVDKIVIAANSDAVKVAMICPPTIYGTGSGEINTRSLQVPNLTRGSLEKGYGLIAGPGLTEWDNVHIDDLGDFYVRLFNATQDPELRSNPEIFGPKAYFFAENGSHKWSDVARSIVDEAVKQGYLARPETKSVGEKEMDSLNLATAVSWGRNSKGVASRARKSLGWNPKGKTIWEEIPPLIPKEGKLLGITPKPQ